MRLVEGVLVLLGRRGRPPALGLVVLVFGLQSSAVATNTTPVRGFTAAPLIARAYDAILDADFERVPKLVKQTCPPAPRVACLGLQALNSWWQIQLDPQSRALDAEFRSTVDAAIDEAGRTPWVDRAIHARRGRRRDDARGRPNETTTAR